MIHSFDKYFGSWLVFARGAGGNLAGSVDSGYCLGAEYTGLGDSSMT